MSEREVITVTGKASIAAPPDIARVRLNCAATRPSVQEAVAASSDAVVAVRAALASHGVAAADAPSGRLAVTTQEVWEDKAPRITGYAAEHQVIVTLRELDAVPEVIAAVVAAAGDALRLQGIEFAVEDEAPLAKAAREQAVANAKESSEQLAGAAGRALGDVVGIEELGSEGPVPVVRARLLAASADRVPVEPGASEVTAAVRVTWTLA